MKLKISSWNVNGIRAIIKKGDFDKYLESYQPDILCLQETKARQEQVDLEMSGYSQYWNSAEKAGYSGTAIFSKIKPISVDYGIGVADHDREGRVICLEFKKIFLVTVYTPNSQNGLKRLAYRTEQWDRDFLSYVEVLRAKKEVIFCGDLNVAHREIDLANPKTNKKNPGFTPEERASFDDIVASDFVDTFRHFDQSPDNYTWWSYRTAARTRNIGWRIDYVCASKGLMKHIDAAHIHADALGSDHCPVAIEIDRELF